MKKCEKCGAVIPDEAKFCPECGAINEIIREKQQETIDYYFVFDCDNSRNGIRSK